MQSSPRQDSQFAAFVTSTFFLLVPIIVLLIFAERVKLPPQRQASGAVSEEEQYQQAVRAVIKAQSSPVALKLVSLDLSKPVRVATWMGHDAAKQYGVNTTRALKDTWVTVVPNLKNFCQDYVKSHGADLNQLSLRLKQRLGLPPSVNYDKFVELTVDPKDLGSFFRPCGDPSPASGTCQPATALKPDELRAYLNATDAKGKQALGNRLWFLNNY